MRYEVSVYTVVKNVPKLSKDQIVTLQSILRWWNCQCDGWYTTEPAAVYNALNGEKINLIDVQRIIDAIGSGWIYKDISPENKKAFDKLSFCLKESEKILIEDVKYKKMHNKLLKEADSVSKQLMIARYSAVAAIASAMATIILAYLAYLSNS